VRNDIGAYECHDSSLLSIHDEQVIRQGFSIISIITRRQEAEIQYRIDTPVNLSISLINAAGLVITDTAQSPGVPGIYSIRLGERRLRPGLYVCIFKTNEWSVSKKFIID
jgi:hypothetical protein